MRISRFEVRTADVARAAGGAPARVLFVKLTAENGVFGLGTATPGAADEAHTECLAGLESARWLEHADPLDIHVLSRRLEDDLAETPGARAAIDVALHDLWSRLMEAPLTDLLGRAHHALASTHTLRATETETLALEARTHAARGVRAFKFACRGVLEDDVTRLARLRRELGPAALICADARAGYELAEVPVFLERTRELGLEYVEQPVTRDDADELRKLPVELRTRLAADGSLRDEDDARTLLRDPRPFGIWKLSLAKCGGIAPALRLAALARREGIAVAWSSADESVAGIAAALHAACATSATRWADFDASLDPRADPARGGFALAHGTLRTLPDAGLGVALA